MGRKEVRMTKCAGRDPNAREEPRESFSVTVVHPSGCVHGEHGDRPALHLKCPSCPYVNGCPGKCGWQRNAVALSDEDMPPSKEQAHSCTANHRGGARGRPCSAGRTFGTYAEALVGPSLDAGGLVRPRSLHSPSRRRLEREHRQLLLRRRPVLALDMGIGRRSV